MRPDSLDHVALYVRDVARSVAWYRDVMGLERRHADAWGDYPAVMAAGDSGVALFPARGPDAPPSGRLPGAFAHVAFRTSAAGLRGAMAELRARGVPFEEQDHGIARSLYVRDPDGHQVELTTYEVGGARPPALGPAAPILHVRALAAAEAFYRDRLGFRRLFPDGPLADPGYAALARAAATLHLSSFPGEGAPGAAIYLPVDDVDALHAELAARGVAVALPPAGPTWGMREAHVRDPDGNALRFGQPVRRAADRAPAGLSLVRGPDGP